MHSCILCSNSSPKTTNRSVTFHSFPRDPVRRSRWLQALKLTECTDWHRVCSEHFSPSDFRPGDKRLLWPFALPKLSTVTQTSGINDSTDNTSQLENMSNLPNTGEPAASVISNITTSSSSSSVTANSPRRSSRKIKPSSLSDDSTYVNTSLILSDQEEEKNDKTLKKKKKIKETMVTNGMRCAAKNCQNKYPTNNLSFFGFPGDISLRKIWIKNCGIEHLVGPEFIVKSNYKVCRCHFEDSMFYNTLKRNRLVANAIPTIIDGKVLPCSENESVENAGAMESSKSQNTSDKQNLDNDENRELTFEESLSVYACVIPGCIYSAASLKDNPKANPKPVALFSPSSIENMNDWSSICGMRLNMKSNVCERHFNPDDISTRDIYMTDSGLGKIKSLNVDAVPVKIKKYGGSLKRSRANCNDEDISKKKNRSIADKSNSISKFGESSKHKDTEVIENDLPMSILNSTKNLNNESINSLSNLTSNSSTKNNSQSSLEQILPKILANNSLSISLQPNVEKSKHSLMTECTKVTNAIVGLNQNKKSVEELSITSQHNSILGNIQSNLSHIFPNILTNNSSLSITVEKNANKSTRIVATQSTEGVVRTFEIKPEPLDDVPQPISIDSSNADEIPSPPEFEQIHSDSSSTNSDFSKNKQPTHSEVDLPYLHATVDIKPEIIDEDIDSTFKSEPTEVALSNSVEDSSPNFEQPFPNTSSSILLTALQSVCSLRKTSVGNSFSNSQHSISIQNEQEILRTQEVSDSVSSIPIIKNKKTSIKSNPPNIVSNEIEDLNDIPSAPLESNSLHDFIFNTKYVILPNQFWLSYYNSSQNSAVFIQRDEFMSPIKRVYFRNSFVPKIFINGKPYEYKSPVKTKPDLENLLEDIDDIIICSGYDGYSHETCIGYFENTSEEIEVCRNCQNLIKGKYMPRMDAALETKASLLMHLNNQVAEMQIRLANTKKLMQKQKKLC